MPAILVIFTVSHTPSVKYPQGHVTESLPGTGKISPFPHLSLSLPSPPSPLPEGHTQAVSPSNPRSLPATTRPHLAAAQLPWLMMNGIPMALLACGHPASACDRARARTCMAGCQCFLGRMPCHSLRPLYSGSCNLDSLPRPNCYL